MQFKFWRFDLELTHRWTISSGLGPGGSGGTTSYKVVFVELRDGHDTVGLGEAAPSSRYQENVDTVLAFLQRVDAGRLSFADVPASMAYLDTVAPGNYAAKGALNIALLDGAAKLARKPIYDLLGLGFTENKHVTSFSIGIDTPEKIQEKVKAAADYPVLKLKVGSSQDEENLAALRAAAPTKPVRVDANEAWKTKEEALARIQWLAGDRFIQFIEQPMPATNPKDDWVWLRSRSPLPIMADESYFSVRDIAQCAGAFHA
ncbi:MAG: enolase C-terminal domain-like protein, partial [Verrucomicrobiota bacterium]